DQINFTVTVEQPANMSLRIQGFKDTLIKNIEIIRGPRIDSAKIGSDRVKIISKYLITSFDSGYYQVKPVYAETATASGLKRFYSDYARLEVMKYSISPADSTARIYDIVGPYKAPVTFNEILPWILLLLIVAAIAWFVVRYFRNRKKAPVEETVFVNPDPAHVIAFRELEKLKAEELWQKGQVKNYYTRLTEILRQYLENRYRVYSLEMTTSETLNELLKTGFKKDELFSLLRNVLTAADLVKFAKYVPDAEEHELNYQNSWKFVDATKPEEIRPVQSNQNNNGVKEESK
ncbi:MAG TPA: hypothetical protein VHO68_00390, partial [Bacteroidales bacterium]|nr:hypothetical protein [Bacteroidales bacterium]